MVARTATPRRASRRRAPHTVVNPVNPDADGPTFSELPLREELLQGVAAVGFRHLTPIQAAALPLLLTGRDTAGQAQTGTGKTAAFLLACMQHLLGKADQARPGRPRAIVISPTRELAVQIYQDAEALGQHSGLSFMLVHGGVEYTSQLNGLDRGTDLLIGTPGRLIDLYRRRSLDLGDIQAMVLDEADRMFDLGFIRDVRFLLRRMPPPTRRLNMLFSATLHWRAIELAHEHMAEPEVILLRPEEITVDKITQQLYHVAGEEKPALLIGLLRDIDTRRVIVFVNTRHKAESIDALLNANGFHAAVLSGDIPQHKRLKIFRAFSEGRLHILVATDLAARGLHVPDVSHVFNYDMPFSGEDYVHRIGRTARAGASGDALSLACEEYVYSLPDIERYLGYKIPVAHYAGELPQPVVPNGRRRTGRARRGAAPRAAGKDGRRRPSRHGRKRR